MDVLKRRMFQDGGSVGPQEVPSKVLSRRVEDIGYRNPYQEIIQIEQQGDLFFERVYDRNGRLKNERLIDRNLSATGDIQEALSRQKTNEMVRSAVETTPLLIGGGLAGLGLKAAAGTNLGKNILQGAGKTGSGIINFLAPFKMNPKFVKNPNLGKPIKGKTDKDGNPIIDTQKKVLQDRGVTESFDKNYLGIPKSLNEITIKPITSAAYGVAGSTAAVDPIADALTTTPDEVQEQFEQQILDSDMSQLEKLRALESARAQKDPLKYAQSIADFDEDLDAILEETAKEADPDDDTGDGTTGDGTTGDGTTGDGTTEEKGEGSGVAAAQTTANSLSNFFSSSAFNDALRNIGGSLVKEGRFGAGLAGGAASFADEQEAKSLLQQERMAKLMEAQAASGLSVSDKLSIDKAVNEKQLELAKNIKDYNNALAGYNLANQVLEFAKTDEDLATFGAKFGAFGDRLLAQAGLKKITDVEDMKPIERAQVALKILTNANIKEILGESGRTISNIDREIAKSVVGDLEDFTKLNTLADIKIKLEENLNNITQKGNLAQRQIRSNVQFLLGYTPDLFETDPEVLEIIQKDFGVTSEKPTSSEVGAIQPRVVKTSLRD